MRKEVVDWIAYLRNSIEYNTNKPTYRKQERLRDGGVLVGGEPTNIYPEFESQIVEKM